MRKFASPLLIILVFTCCRQEIATDENLIAVGSKDSLYSEILNEQREFWVRVPESFTGKERYPVVYLLDGDWHFYSVAGMIRQLSTTNGNTVVPEMVVVGIPNTDRFRDLTPTHVGDSTSTSGGGDNFTKFIRDELIPHIDKNYPTRNYRTMIGHSLGGLIAINTLVNYPEMFSNYLAIDPSLWWDNRKLLGEAKDALIQRQFEGKSLFVAVANTMPKGMDTTKVVSDTARGTNHIRAILEFSEFTSSKVENGLNFSWRYYDNEDHGSVPLIAEHDGLKFMFAWHKFPKWSEVLDSEKSADDLLDLIVSHYENVSGKLGYEVLPSLGQVNFVGSTLLRRGMTEKAFAMFDLNIQNYPDNSEAYESMGDYYVAQSDTVNAIKFFEMAVKRGGSLIAKEKLDDISNMD